MKSNAKSESKLITTSKHTQKYDVREGQSVELLKELHILTRDGKMNQDSRRKLKQIYHLYQFIEPLLSQIALNSDSINLVDHGAGKSYLGFILYDLFFKQRHDNSRVYGIETREELVSRSQELAKKLAFDRMSFLKLSIAESIKSELVPPQIDIVTALHACNTATDDAIEFGLQKKVRFIVLVPCCQAELATILKKNRSQTLATNTFAELWRHPIHTREFGSHLTNVLRCLRLEACGYSLTVTELVGLEHSMKNELIIAEFKNRPEPLAAKRLIALLEEFGLLELKERFAINTNG